MSEAPTLTAMSSRVRGMSADLLVSGSVAGLSTWWWHQFRLGGVLFGVLAGLVLLGRRHRPLTVLAVVAVLTTVTATIEVNGTKLHDGMLLVTITAAMYAAIVHTATMRRAVAGGVGAWVAGAVVLPLQNGAGTGWASLTVRDIAGNFWFLTGYAALIWAVGLTVRYVRQLREAVAERRHSEEREREHVARIAVAEERARIARELHDIVAHSLSVIILHANGAAYAFDHDQRRAREALRTIGATGSDALEEIRQLVELLRGGDNGGGEGVGGGGPSDRIPGGLDQVGAVVQRARDAGLTAELVVHGEPPEVPGGVALAVCRIVQESLTNTLKHAGPEPAATVTVNYRPGVIDIEVTNAGAVAGPEAPGGHGLVGMRERVALYGGTFEAGPVPGGGWRVRAGIPLAAARAVTA